MEVSSSLYQLLPGPENRVGTRKPGSEHSRNIDEAGKQTDGTLDGTEWTTGGGGQNRHTGQCGTSMGLCDTGMRKHEPAGNIPSRGSPEFRAPEGRVCRGKLRMRMI